MFSFDQLRWGKGRFWKLCWVLELLKIVLEINHCVTGNDQDCFWFCSLSLDRLASASWLLGFWACATMAGLPFLFILFVARSGTHCPKHTRLSLPVQKCTNTSPDLHFLSTRCPRSPLLRSRKLEVRKQGTETNWQKECKLLLFFFFKQTLALWHRLSLNSLCSQSWF